MIYEFLYGRSGDNCATGENANIHSFFDCIIKEHLCCYGWLYAQIKPFQSWTSLADWLGQWDVIGSH